VAVPEAAIRVGEAVSPGPAIVHELLYKAKAVGLRIAKVPIVFREREQGSSTPTFRKLLRSYVTVLRLRWLGLTGRLLSDPSAGRAAEHASAPGGREATSSPRVGGVADRSSESKRDAPEAGARSDLTVAGRGRY